MVLLSICCVLLLFLIGESPCEPDDDDEVIPGGGGIEFVRDFVVVSTVGEVVIILILFRNGSSIIW